MFVIQGQHFSQDTDTLLLCMHLFLDSDGLLRAGSRISDFTGELTSKHLPRWKDTCNFIKRCFLCARAPINITRLIIMRNLCVRAN